MSVENFLSAAVAGEGGQFRKVRTVKKSRIARTVPVTDAAQRMGRCQGGPDEAGDALHCQPGLVGCKEKIERPGSGIVRLSGRSGRDARPDGIGNSQRAVRGKNGCEPSCIRKIAAGQRSDVRAGGQFRIITFLLFYRLRRGSASMKSSLFAIPGRRLIHIFQFFFI